MPKPTYQELAHRVRVLEETEHKLSESEEKFRLAFHTNPDSINLNRASDGLYLDINEGFTQIMGYDRADVVGKTSLELDIWSDPQDRARLVAGLAADGCIFNLEAKFRRKDGQVIIGLMSARILRINQEDVILSIARDITESKKVEQSLRASEYRYRTLFEKAHDAIFIVDKQTGRYLDANAAAEQLTGRPAVDLCRLTTQDISPTGAETRLAATISTSGLLNLGRVTYVRPDGTKRIAMLSTVPLDDKRVFGIARDITHEVKLEEQYRQAQKMEAFGQLAGGIAHDFNNLLVPIIGHTELVMMRSAEGEKTRNSLKQIKKAAERAADLTRQILAFSRRQVLELKILDLNEIIRDFQQMAGRLLRENIELQIYLAPAPGQIQADKTQIEQILMNLVINASDAMPDGGKLTIETANIFLDETYLEQFAEGRKAGSYIMLAIADNGIGMDAETRQHIFEPFFTTKEPGKGTGLGLATVFGIVEQHQGHIWVYSEPNQGTTFKIYLPRVGETSPSAAVPESRTDSVYGSETVLVVEDEEMVRKLVCETLTAYGYHVLEAGTPTHALELVKKHIGPLDLLLTDVIMPQMNGRELHQNILAVKPDIKTLYMSGYTDNVIVHHGVLDRNINLLNKPFSISTLTHKVRAVLDQRAGTP